MGADGHITIYKLDKFYDKYDEETVDSFFGHFTSSTLYIQSLEGVYYMTRYYGDNLSDCTDLYDVVENCYNKEVADFKTMSYAYSKHEADYFMKFDKEHRECFYEMIDFLEKECRLTEWEVWT